MKMWRRGSVWWVRGGAAAGDTVRAGDVLVAVEWIQFVLLCSSGGHRPPPGVFGGKLF